MPAADIREPRDGELGELADLLQSYLQEAHGSDWHGSVDALRDTIGSAFEARVAVRAGAIVGFVAWQHAYDLHHCIHGGDLLDLYVVPGERGRGIAVQLICAAAAAVHASGGLFLQGSAPGSGGARRLYERIAMTFPGVTCIAGGRAFRRLAELEGASASRIGRMLPPKEWNFEP